MKRLLLILVLFVGMSNINAQCIPDPQYTDAGIYPDTATGLSDAMVGQAYNELVTVITPLDTNVVYSGIPLLVTIDYIALTGVTGLPPNFAYDCDPIDCSFPGGSTGCAEIYSTSNPVAADIGLYPITFNTTTQVSGIPIIGSTTQDDVTSGYYIEIKDNVASVIDKYYSHTFELKEAFPNPSSHKTNIQFISGVSQNISFVIYNLLGEVIYSNEISANTGINTITISTSDFSDGVYMYSINNRESILTKRMIVSH